MAGRGDGERSEPLAPAGYAELLEQLKQRVRSARVQAARAADVELLLVDRPGHILDRQGQAGWGSKAGWGRKVIDRLPADLRAAFPDYRGFSVRNLQLHAGGGRGTADGVGVSADTGCRIDLEPPDVAAHRGRRSAATRLVRGEVGGARLVAHATFWRIAAGLDRRVGRPSNFLATLPAVDSELSQR